MILSISSFMPAFQFQFGAIKRNVKYHFNFTSLEFQFQFGAIKSGFIESAATNKDVISIPIWCD